MRTAIAFLILSFYQFASAGFFTDGWNIEKIETAPSIATKSDGTQITIPNEQVVFFKMVTVSQNYGGFSRTVKKQKVENGRIVIEVESSNELQCGDHQPESSLNILDPDAALAKVTATPGIYEVWINDIKAGTVDTTATPVKWDANPDYKKTRSEQNNKKYLAVFGAIENYSSKSTDATFKITDAGSNKIKVDYTFDRKETTEKNGDIQIQIARKGSAEMELSTIETTCDGASKMKWEGVNGASLTVRVESDGSALGLIQFGEEASNRSIDIDIKK